MIDKIIALTIPKRINRCWLFTGYNLAKGVPLEKISFWRGEVPITYGDSFNRIADAAEDDGFPFIRYFQGYENITVLKQSPAQMCQLWGYVQILRYIKESGETCLIIWDDRFIATPFSLLDTICQEMEDAGDFYLFQLRLRGENGKDFIMKESIDIHIQQEMFDAYIASGDMPISYRKCFTKRGMYGFDETIIFTPKGANWLLDQFFNIEDVDPDLKKHNYFDLLPEHLPLYMKCVNIDSFLNYGLRLNIKKAMEEKKGIYCPRSQGYNFVNEPIAMGSDTGFLTEFVSGEYHYYAEETKLQFLN